MESPTLELNKPNFYPIQIQQQLSFVHKIQKVVSNEDLLKPTYVYPTHLYENQQNKMDVNSDIHSQR